MRCSGLLERPDELMESLPDGTALTPLRKRSLLFFDPGNGEEGKPSPPEAHRKEGIFDRFSGLGKAEPLGLQNHQHVDEKQESSAQVTQGITQARHIVNLLFRSYVGKERIIESNGTGKPHHPQHVDQDRQSPIPLLNPEKTDAHERSEVGKKNHELFFCRPSIGDSPKNRSHHRDQQSGKRIAESKLSRAHIHVRPKTPVLLKKKGEEAGHDRCREG